MDVPWGILISIFVIGLAFLIKHFAGEVVEEDNHFWGILVLYFVAYTAAAIGIAYLTPGFSVNTAIADTPTAEEAVRLDAP